MTFNSAWAHLLIDMDGVLWRGSTPLPGLSAFFAALHATERRFMLVTNNSRLTPEQYVTKLARMGITVTTNEVVTSAVGTAEYLRQHACSDRRGSWPGGRNPSAGVGPSARRGDQADKPFDSSPGWSEGV
ncbi:MAG: hypothetical protein IIA90_06815 [Chloroflexi bacterium]|nr:hypothetical protein [Chloroflexota bacterium]